MKRIEREMKERGITQTALAEETGIHRVTVNRIIGGKQAPGFGEGQSAERIAQAIGYAGDLHALFEEIGGE